MTHKKILLVDDNESDLDLMQDVLNNFPCTLTLAMRGQDALQKIESIPDLIVLDLNLPDAFGLDILKHIKSSPHLRHIPVIIFSTSEDPNDIKDAYSLQASTFLTKPLELDTFLECVQSIGNYWVNWAKMKGGDLFGG